jgi:hypothetical protein
LRLVRDISRVVLLVLVSTCAQAAEVLPFLENGMLGATVRGLQLPQSAPKDLRSGLTNHVMVRVTLQAPGRPTGQRVAEIAVKYDLWDETFRFTLTLDGRVLRSETHATLAAVMAGLQDLALPSLFPEAGLAQGVSHTLRAEVLLNPIDAERMEKIRIWVAENSTYAPGQAGLPDNRTTSTSNDLFNRIFEQFASGASTVAAWRETATSAAFRPETVPHERP